MLKKLAIFVSVFLLESPIALGQQAATRPSTPTTRRAPATQRSSTRPARRLPYTAPGGSFRGVGGAVVRGVGAASMGQLDAAAQEASQSSVAGSRAIGAGAPGLSAPQALSANAVVGQPGIQRGLAIGLGPLPQQNIFTRSINPITGPGGACSQLSGAGFSPQFCGGAAMKR
jgi:hypothetical protein